MAQIPQFERNLKTLLAENTRRTTDYFKKVLLLEVLTANGNFRAEIPLEVARAGQRVFGDQETDAIIAECLEAISELVLDTTAQAV